MISKASSSYLSFSSFNRLWLFLIWMIFIVQQGTSARKLARSLGGVPGKSGVNGNPSGRAPSAEGGGFPYPTGQNGNGGSSPFSPGGQTYPYPSPSKEASPYGSQQNCGYVNRCVTSPYGGVRCGPYYTCTPTGSQNCNTYTSCTGYNNCSTYTNCGSSSPPNQECISGTCYTDP